MGIGNAICILFRFSLLCLNFFLVAVQISFMNYVFGFAMCTQIDFLIVVVLVVNLVLRAVIGPMTLPFSEKLKIVYRLGFSFIAIICFIRLAFCLIYLRLCCVNWDEQDPIRNVRYIYYWTELIVWSLQLAMNISFVRDFKLRSQRMFLPVHHLP